MKKTKLAMPGILVILALNLLSCSQEEGMTFTNVEASIKKMEDCNEEMKYSIYTTLKSSDEKNPLLTSKFLQSNTSRAAVEEDFLDDEIEDEIIENVSEEEKEAIIKIAQEYIDRLEEIGKVKVFDEKKHARWND